jgi:hypothetical protein
MLSANQLYKNSGSELPFKEWLKREQLKGTLQREQTVRVEPKPEKDKFLNADGDLTEDEQAAQQALEDFFDEFVNEGSQENEYVIKRISRQKFGYGLVLGIALGYGIKYLIDRRK